MTNKVEPKTVPDRVLRDFGSKEAPDVSSEPTITPDNLALLVFLKSLDIAFRFIWPFLDPVLYLY